MKTSTRIQGKAATPTAAVQSKTPSDALPVCDPNEIAKDWVLLRLGKDDDDGNLWASREGLIYLWHDDQAYHLPRVVSTAEAQRWIAEHGQDGWCEPYFPEDSPAYELVNVPREAEESSGVLAAVRRADELENAINQAAALNELMEHRILHLDGSGGYSDEIQCGLIELSAATFNRLRRAAGDEQQAA